MKANNATNQSFSAYLSKKLKKFPSFALLVITAKFEYKFELRCKAIGAIYSNYQPLF